MFGLPLRQISVMALLSLVPSSFAIHLGRSDSGVELPWGQSLSHPLDQPVNDKYSGKAFFMNLGPTGIRAKIEPDHPKAFKVMYVFQDRLSPAKGMINIGDYIVGANGKMFKEPHGFHRKEGGRGWPGPPFELAHAIEDCQGKDGVLRLIVRKGGPKAAVTKVALQLKPVGRFSKTYPWNCPRSDKLREDLADFMADNFPNNVRLWLKIQYTLALWASGDRRGASMGKDLAKQLANNNYDPMAGGMCTWNWGYMGIMMGEYYNTQKSGSVKSAVRDLLVCYETGQDFRNGGFSHTPFPAIQRRVASGGSSGYGAMAGPGGLSMLAQSIFKQTGLPYSQLAYERTHQAFLRTAGDGNMSGSIAYGFKGWESTHIRVADHSPCKSKKGIGFLCPTGMENIGTFRAEESSQSSNGKWDTKLVTPNKFPWLKKDTDLIRLYDAGKNRRLAVRPQYLPEPRSPYKNNEKGGGHIAPVGMGALAHFIGNNGNKPWNHLGKHMATCCAYSPKTLWDGHAAAEMHAFFGVLGAARADERDFRHFLDYSKTWIILSESHDGQGLIDQPFGCQRNSTCSINRNRMAYTHVALLLLSLPQRKLLITGADAGKPALMARSSGSYRPASSAIPSYTTPSTPSTGSRTLPKGFVPYQPPREPRKLSKKNAERLEKALAKVLIALNRREPIQSKPLDLSLFNFEVSFAGIDNDGVQFKNAKGQVSRKYTLEELSSRDIAKLSALAAKVSDSKDMYAITGIFWERLGQVKTADTYYRKAGETSQKKFEKLFD